MTGDPTTLTIRQLAAAYRDGTLRPTVVTEAYLEKCMAGDIYREVLAGRAREQAKLAERQFEAGVDVGALQGVPLAIKDLLDTEGAISAAGSLALLRSKAPATADAPAIARLDAAGAVFLGRTTMTELAFSGVGLNPHFGTPPNAFDPRRIPGGSSSGSAVAVAKGMACAAIGSDTGGSVRIPAAFNGLVGLKTSEGTVPTDGSVELSFTLDTIGPITRDVDDAWLLFNTLAALPASPLPQLPPRLTLLAPTTVLQEELDPEVAREFEGTLERLRDLGHEVTVGEVPLLREIEQAVVLYGSIAAHEALALHEELLAERGAEMDPRVRGRIEAVSDRPSKDYLKHLLGRRRWRRQFWQDMAGFDALLAPTVPILPPLMEELREDESYFETNRLCLRNTSLFNALGGCAVSIPAGNGPIGTMIAAGAGNEGLVLALGKHLS